MPHPSTWHSNAPRVPNDWYGETAVLGWLVSKFARITIGSGIDQGGGPSAVRGAISSGEGKDSDTDVGHAAGCSGADSVGCSMGSVAGSGIDHEAVSRIGNVGGSGIVHVVGSDIDQLVGHAVGSPIGHETPGSVEDALVKPPRHESHVSACT